MNKKFLLSVATGIMGLSLIASCSLLKKESHTCGGKNGCAAKKGEAHKCAAKKDAAKVEATKAEATKAEAPKAEKKHKRAKKAAVAAVKTEEKKN